MRMVDLVSVQVFCSDVALLETFNGVYRSCFSEEFRARAFIGSGPRGWTVARWEGRTRRALE
jgi:enamine deaminase RidA (YjgF/YER057c/UK114 family)